MSPPLPLLPIIKTCLPIALYFSLSWIAVWMTPPRQRLNPCRAVGEQHFCVFQAYSYFFLVNCHHFFLVLSMVVSSKAAAYPPAELLAERQGLSHLVSPFRFHAHSSFCFIFVYFLFYICSLLFPSYSNISVGIVQVFVFNIQVMSFTCFDLKI